MARKSTGKYPSNWGEIANDVKDEHNWQCIRCKHLHDPQGGYTLTVHHADMNPANNAWYNLLCLCQRCHLQIQAKVILERPWYLPHSEWFRPYVAGYFASRHDLPTDKEFVFANVERLIALGQSAILDHADTSEFVAELAAAWPSLEDVE